MANGSEGLIKRIGREIGHDWHFVKRQIAAIRLFLSERGIRP